VLGRMRGTLTFDRSHYLHTLIVVISLYYFHIRAIYKHFLLLLSKYYIAVAAFAQRLQAVFYSYLIVLLRCSTT
jgi:hypothetical protein